MNISAIVLVRNEEDVIERCLKSLAFVSEIIIIDNGSTDRTASLVKNFTSKIIRYDGTDFAGARNLGRDSAKNGWLLYVDADEIVGKELSEEIVSSLKAEYSAYSMTRENFFYGQKWPVKDNTVRLIKKNALVKWHGKVHESPEIKGKVGALRNPLVHFTHADIGKMVEKTNLWSEIEADLRIKSHHKPVKSWRLVRVMLTSFFDSYAKGRGYKKGIYGFIEGFYQAFSSFITYSKLWERQQKSKKS